MSPQGLPGRLQPKGPKVGKIGRHNTLCCAALCCACGKINDSARMATSDAVQTSARPVEN